MARISNLNITYKGKDISKDISASLINFTYTDNEQGKADEIELLLENKKGLWSGSWYPEKGSVIEAGLKLYDWNKMGEIINVKWGRFTIDELTLSSAGTFLMKAISEKCAGAFSTEKKCRTFENITLKDMVTKIADENNICSLYIKPRKILNILNFISFIIQTALLFLFNVIKLVINAKYQMIK